MFKNCEGIGNFSEGKAWIKTTSSNDNTIFEYIDTSFNTLFQVETMPFCESQDYLNGLCVIYSCMEECFYQVIDDKGNKVTKYYDQISSFTDGKSIFNDNGKLYLVTDNNYSSHEKDEISSWAVDAVEKANNLDLIPMNLKNNYKENITRQDFSALVIRCIEKKKDVNIWFLLDDSDRALDDIKNDLTEKNKFADSADPNVIAAKMLGIINGRGNKQFAPNDFITREEAATLLMRTAQYLGKEITIENNATSYADDSKTSSFAKQPINFVSSIGIMKGTDNNQFNPKGTYTREQAYTTMYRLFIKVD